MGLRGRVSDKSLLSGVLKCRFKTIKLGQVFLQLTDGSVQRGRVEPVGPILDFPHPSQIRDTIVQVLSEPFPLAFETPNRRQQDLVSRTLLQVGHPPLLQPVQSLPSPGLVFLCLREIGYHLVQIVSGIPQLPPGLTHRIRRFGIPIPHGSAAFPVSQQEPSDQVPPILLGHGYWPHHISLEAPGGCTEIVVIDAESVDHVFGNSSRSSLDFLAILYPLYLRTSVPATNLNELAFDFDRPQHPRQGLVA